MTDDSRHLRLDVKELLLNICIGDFRLPFSPRFEMTWQRNVALFLYNRPHVMKGVVRIPHTANRLLDARELRYVAEHVHARLILPELVLHHLASGFYVAGESIIQTLMIYLKSFFFTLPESKYTACECCGEKQMST